MKNPFENINIEPAAIGLPAGLLVMAGGVGAIIASGCELSYATDVAGTSKFDAAMQLGEQLNSGGQTAVWVGAALVAASAARFAWVSWRR